MTYQEEFIRFMVDSGVLTFGDFVTKSGRKTPYFVNTGNYKTGAQAARLGDYYAACIQENMPEGIDALFGPAYKGIPLVTTASASLFRNYGRDLPYCFNRKEAKDHGEGGTLVGAPLKGKVVIIDDVITAGTSVRESVEIIRNAGAEPAAVLIAMDRMERAGADDALSAHSAVQDVAKTYGIPVVAIASLADIMALLQDDAAFAEHRDAVQAYRTKYGVK